MTNPATILNLPAATTPLTGNELVPMTQNGITVQTPASSLLGVSPVFTTPLTAAGFIPTGPTAVNGLFLNNSLPTIGNNGGLGAFPVASFQSGGFLAQNNYFLFEGANDSGNLFILVRGSGTNVGISRVTSGSGSHTFFTGGPSTSATQFRISHTAGTTSFITVTGSNGTSPQISASSGDVTLVPSAGHNIVVGLSTVGTSATSGFLWVPSCAGAPTGVLTPPYSGASALAYDTTDNKLYVYNSTGTPGWKSVTLT